MTNYFVLVIKTDITKLSSEGNFKITAVGNKIRSTKKRRQEKE